MFRLLKLVTGESEKSRKEVAAVPADAKPAPEAPAASKPSTPPEAPVKQKTEEGKPKEAAAPAPAPAQKPADKKVAAPKKPNSNVVPKPKPAAQTKNNVNNNNNNNNSNNLKPVKVLPPKVAPKSSSGNSTSKDAQKNVVVKTEADADVDVDVDVTSATLEGDAWKVKVVSKHDVDVPDTADPPAKVVTVTHKPTLAEVKKAGGLKQQVRWFFKSKLREEFYLKRTQTYETPIPFLLLRLKLHGETYFSGKKISGVAPP